MSVPALTPPSPAEAPRYSWYPASPTLPTSLRVTPRQFELMLLNTDWLETCAEDLYYLNKKTAQVQNLLMKTMAWKSFMGLNHKQIQKQMQRDTNPPL
ncbi:hypothetical protein DSO57_1023965 [Entomophthora muscae]|uniref:Uncharacterized protein n=1 Tax=Entomophthora muscae TaxID=34485 RepID=A0ACC2S4K7_9FUNG|nr:hypothetical protein DSO57_1023965 [Entomophthora muscae]